MNREVQFSARVWERLAGRAALITAMVAGLAAAFSGARPLLAQSPAVPAISGPYAKWLNEDVVYIISPVERAAFERLTSDPEREKFIEQFWQVRDPTLGTAVNENKEEHYRRIAYAINRFRGKTPAW